MNLQFVGYTPTIGCFSPLTTNKKKSKWLGRKVKLWHPEKFGPLQISVFVEPQISNSFGGFNAMPCWFKSAFGGEHIDPADALVPPSVA